MKKIIMFLMCMSLVLVFSGCNVISKTNKEYVDLKDKKANYEFSFNDSSLQEESLYPLSTGTCYYVSSTGNDSNDGLTVDTPIKTIAKANTIKLKAGDSLLFKRGDIFTGNLSYANLEATKENPITIASYGDGDVKPLLTNGKDKPATIVVSILNSSGVVVRDLSIDIYARSRFNKTSIAGGIFIRYEYVGEKKYSDIYVVNNTIRGYDYNGKYIDEDSDATGINISSQENTHDGSPLEVLTNCYVLNNEVSYCGRVGIKSGGWINENGGQNEMHRNKFKNLYFNGNVVHHIGGLGLYIQGGTHCTIERNLVYQTGITTDKTMIEGQCGIMYLCSEYSTCRYNVVHDIYDGNTGWDAMGIDIDWNTDHIIVEYNYCYNCLGDGIGTMSNQHSTIANNRLENNLGKTNHTASICLDNFTCRLYPVPDDFHSITYCKIVGNLIIHNQQNVPVFHCTTNNGDTDYVGNEFTDNHIVLKSNSNPDNFTWINIEAPLQWYKFANNKYYSDSVGAFKVYDSTTNLNLNLLEGAKEYEVTKEKLFSTWQTRDLNSTYEKYTDAVPTEIKEVKCTYSNGKLTLDLGEKASDVWHYNIYKVGFNESASYLNLIGEASEKTFGYDVLYSGEFYLIIQPESNEGIYGQGIKVKVTIK